MSPISGIGVHVVNERGVSFGPQVKRGWGQKGETSRDWKDVFRHRRGVVVRRPTSKQKSKVSEGLRGSRNVQKGGKGSVKGQSDPRRITVEPKVRTLETRFTFKDQPY